MNQQQNQKQQTTTKPGVATKATKAEFKCKISSLKLCEEFLNKIKNEEKNTNETIFRDYFFIRLHHIQQKVYMIVVKIKMMKL